MSEPHTPETSDDGSVSANEDTEPSGRAGEFADSPDTDLSSQEEDPSSCLPRDDYYCLLEALAHIHLAPVPTQHLFACTRAACNMMRSVQRAPAGEAEHLRRLIREIIPQCMEACFREQILPRYSEHQHEQLLHIIGDIGDLAIEHLKLCMQHSTYTEAAEEEQDCLLLLQAFTWGMDWRNPYHEQWHRQGMFQTPTQFASAEPILALAAVDAEADTDMEQHQYQNQFQYPYLIYLIECFGRGGGFTCLCAVLADCAKYSIALLDAVLNCLHQVADHVKPEALQPAEQGLVAVLLHLPEVIQRDEEKLSHHGRDRTYFHFSRMLDVIYTLLVKARMPSAQADEKVAAVQRAFVTCMLSSSNFNKLLSAVRECHKMLERARSMSRYEQSDASWKVSMDWLDSANVVKLMLRSNLHQRQYVEQVGGIISLLSECHGLKDAHLEMLWNVTEQDGTFDTVKTNVYNMLADSAPYLLPSQLDWLFLKFSATRDRPVGDALRIMELLYRLAKSDFEDGHMSTKLAALMWDMTIPADAPKELLESRILARTLTDYDRYGMEDRSLVQDCLLRCMQELQHRRNIFPAVRVMAHLIISAPREAEMDLPGIMTRKSVQAFLGAEEHNAPLTLVNNLQHLLLSARQALETADPPAVPPGQGNYTYQEIIEAHLTLLRLIGIQFLQLPLLEQLWDLLVVHPVTPHDAASGLQWFNQIAKQLYKKPHLEEEQAVACHKLLVERVTHLNPQSVTESGWHCFVTYFELVNKEEETLVITPSRTDEQDMVTAVSLDLIGLDFMWEVAVCAADHEVSEEARDYLADLYMNVDQDPGEGELSSAQATYAFVQTCKQKLLQLVASLQQAESPSGHAATTAREPPATLALRVSNCLAVMKQVIEWSTERSMPPVPAHQATFRGMPLQVEVSTMLQPKFRVDAHTNMYTGLLRRAIAARVNQPPQRLRMLTAGKEMNNDSNLLSTHSRISKVTLQVTHSAQDNKFTVPPADYPQTWRQTSAVAMLSNMEDLYEALLHVADMPHDQDMRTRAADLLQMMPTWPRTHAQLAAALGSADPAGSMATLLLGPAAAAAAAVRPSEVLYKLQALYGMLFPPYECVELDGEYDRALSAAPALLNAFIMRSCVPLLFQAIMQACEHNRADVAFQRNINSLLVMIVNSLRATIAAHSAPAHEETSDTEGGLRSGPQKADMVMREEDIAAQEVVGMSEEASEESALQLDGHVFQMMVKYLVNLVSSAGNFWTGTPPAPRDTFEEKLIREALNALQLLLRQDKEQLLPTFLQDSPSSHLISVLLLNRSSLGIRNAASDFLDTLSLASDDPELGLWLLQQLAAHREQAQAAGLYSEQYWFLFSKAVQALEAAPTAEQCAFADGLLDQELMSLRQLKKATGNNLQQEDWDVVLEGRLLLVHALISALDRRSVGASDQGGLLRLLLLRYLFPEASLMSAFPNPADIVVDHIPLHLATPCSSAACRKAAFRLVGDLMTHCVRNLEEGSELLRRLHLGGQAPTHWERQPVQPLRSACGYVGLKNAGATCYMNAVFQQLFMQPTIRELVLGAQEVPEEEKADSLFHQLQNMFGFMALSKQGFFVPRGFWQAFKDYDGQPIDVREHQDAYEFFTRLQDMVDQHLRSTNQQPAMQAVLGGRFAQQIICRDINYRSEREEDFYQISVDVRGKGSLESSLESYVQGELMEGENAYFCEHVGRRVAALKRSCIKQLPYTLAIHLKRFEFDYHTMNRYKVRDRFEFPLQLDMFRFTADGLEELEGKGEATDPPAHPRWHYLYELKGIVVHSGSAFTGHYYSYIKERPGTAPVAPATPDTADTDASSRWFCFDDKCVRPWEVSNLESDCFGGTTSQDSTAPAGTKARQEVERPHSAYILFYERCEQPSPPPAASSQPNTTPSSKSPPSSAPAAAAAATSALAAAVAAPQPSASTPLLPTQPPAVSIPSDTTMTPDGTPSAPPPTPAASPLPPDHPSPSADASMTPVPTPEPPTPSTRVPPQPAADRPIPFHMPRAIYDTVMHENLLLISRQHKFDRDYFCFVRSIIECKWDTLKSSRKSRRTDGASGSGSGRGAASMSIDTQDAGGAGTPASVAPPDAAAQAAAAAAAAAPLSRRNGDVMRARAICVRLATEFLLKVYWPSPQALRQDVQQWEDALQSLLYNQPTAAKMFLDTILAHPGHLEAYFISCPNRNTRLWLAHMSGTSWAMVYLHHHHAGLQSEDEGEGYLRTFNAFWKELHPMLAHLTQDAHECEPFLTCMHSFAKHNVQCATMLFHDEVLGPICALADRVFPHAVTDDIYTDEILLTLRLLYQCTIGFMETRMLGTQEGARLQTAIDGLTRMTHRLLNPHRNNTSFIGALALAWFHGELPAYRLALMLAHNKEWVSALVVAACLEQIESAGAEDDLTTPISWLGDFICSSFIPDDRLVLHKMKFLLEPSVGALSLLQLLHHHLPGTRRLQLLDLLRRCWEDRPEARQVILEWLDQEGAATAVQRVAHWLRRLQQQQDATQGHSEMVSRLVAFMDTMFQEGREQ